MVETSFLFCNLELGIVTMISLTPQTGDMTLDELRAMLEEAARPAKAAAAAAESLTGVAALAAVAASDAALGMQAVHAIMFPELPPPPPVQPPPVRVCAI